ncbi:hypothetical protein [Brevundimonas sp.]|uniref:hypothetical protein n=1 Tax=Brevundimonas sp. TaxID=1871086 RepID=UPI002E15B156|nr:hypothetical protein [Brevundimonas sp.]
MTRNLLSALGLVVVLTAAGSALAQNPEIPATMDRAPQGLAPAGSPREVAQAAADAIGLDCQVEDATIRGRDVSGAMQWEVACAAGDGHVVIGAPEARAVDCLALVGGAAAPCRLPGNADPARAVARLAANAGLACPVNEGRLVGRTPSGGIIYEAGCADEAGAWIERLGDGWTVTECLKVVGRGGECRFTDLAEADAALVRRLAPVCVANRARWMGSSASGDWYEAACADGSAQVARFDPEGRLAETLPCAQAMRIGDGCRLSDTD